jgi:hypothetical protein
MPRGASPTSRRARWSLTAFVAEHEDAAGGCANEASDGGDERRLAGAIRAEQTEEAARRQVHLEGVERERPVRVDLRQPVDAKRRRARLGHRPSRYAC